MTHIRSVSSVILIALALLGVGCAKGVNFGTAQLQSNIPAGGSPEVINVPACEVDMAQLYLTANVVSFEFQNSNGFSFGYNQSGVLPGLGGSINDQISKASMDLVLNGNSSMNTNQTLFANEVSSAQTQTTLNVGINFNGWGVGTTNYSSTPLATVTANGLNMAVSGLKTKVDQSIGYIGRVIQVVGPNTVMINGGVSTGIQVGDTFNVYNVQHFWADNSQPCALGNTYEGSDHVPASPVAVITVTQVASGANNSFATVQLTGANQIQLGAEVIPLNLVAAPKGQPARYLKKKVYIGTVAAQKFQVPGGATFDFGTAVNGQFKTAVNANGFFVGN